MLLKKGLIFLYFLVFCFNSWGNDLHLNLLEASENILEAKEDSLSLKEVKSLVSRDNLDIKISYERLYQAQKDIWLARARFFPYGTGLIFGYDASALWSSLILVELVTSLPSKWYNVQSIKAVKEAQRFSYYSLKENIKNQVALLHYGLLKEEALLSAVEMEIELLESLLVAVEKEVEIGTAPFSDYDKVSIRLLELRDQFLKFKSLHLHSKSAFNIMLGKSPEEGDKLKLAQVEKRLSKRVLKRSLEELTKLALKKSYEIISANYLVKAAQKEKKSTQWSILSFSGIGFDYWSRVRMAGEKVDEAILKRNKVKENLKSQVKLKRSSLSDSIEYLKGEEEIYEYSRKFLSLELESFKAGDLSLRKLLETELIYMVDFRGMVMAHYQSLVRYDDFNRVILDGSKNINDEENEDEEREDDSSSDSGSDRNHSQLKIKVKKKWRKLYISIDPSSYDLTRITTVMYNFDNTELGYRASADRSNNFEVYLKVKKDQYPVKGSLSLRGAGHSGQKLIRFTIK